jgi:hypothetical protein
MDILAAVRAERDRLNKVIALLEGEGGEYRPVLPIKGKTAKKQGRKWTAAEREAMSRKQRALWAKKRKKA